MDNNLLAFSIIAEAGDAKSAALRRPPRRWSGTFPRQKPPWRHAKSAGQCPRNTDRHAPGGDGRRGSGSRAADGTRAGTIFPVRVWHGSRRTDHSAL